MNDSLKKDSCLGIALFVPSRLRVIYLPFNLISSWAAVFFKARASDSLPWLPLFLVTFFDLGILGVEAFISARFAEHLAPAIFGFLAGAGANIIVQGLLSRFTSLNWAFKSPIQFSLGTLLLGFLGSIIFISHGQQVRKIFALLALLKSQSASSLRAFSKIIWAITALLSAGLCLNLAIILRSYGEFETTNPLRKPLWFSIGAIILVFALAFLAKKNLLRLGQILFPGIVVGLVWASIVRDSFTGLYSAFPKFPLAPEVLAVLLVINFCFLGIAWLNNADYSGYPLSFNQNQPSAKKGA